MDFYAASVAKSGAWGALTPGRLSNFCLTVRVQRVVEGPSQHEFFMVIGHGQLESADQRVQTA